MRIDDGFSALKLFENWFKSRIAEVHAIGIREENEAIEIQDIKCVREFLQGAIDTRPCLHHPSEFRDFTPALHRIQASI
jgi:hypothetical protein